MIIKITRILKFIFMAAKDPLILAAFIFEADWTGKSKCNRVG